MGFIARRNLKENTAVVIAFMTWGIVGISFIWHVIVLVWVIVSLFFSSKLYIPDPVRITSYTMAIVMVWILVVYGLSMVWVKFNRFRLNKKKNILRSINQSVFIEKDLPWSEAIISKFDSQNILEDVEIIKQNMSVITLQDPVSTSQASMRHPKKLLNQATVLIRNGQISNGISLLRVILELPQSSPMVKKVANVKLAQCLYELGHKDLAIIKNRVVI